MRPTADRDDPGRGEGPRAPRRSLALRILLAAVVLVALYAGWALTEVVRNVGADDRVDTDAIVVLGAAQYDGTPSPVLKARLDHALELYEQGVAPKVVLTGSKQPADRFTEAYAGFTYLLGRGVPESAMDVVTDGMSTYESLAATARVLQEQGVDRITLVSDGYHNRRMLGIASELGFDATVSPSSSGASPARIGREAVLVAAGELIGYRRLDRLS
ncbi:MAG: YdcF family protein [Microthrixaceae bacterium]|nr:YdcF family protein [Microthrixaceae bacterium]